MTGSVITADKPVFVTSGAKTSTVFSAAYFDHLVEYLQPADITGRNYLVAPLKNTMSGELFRVLSEYRHC